MNVIGKGMTLMPLALTYPLMKYAVLVQTQSSYLSRLSQNQKYSYDVAKLSVTQVCFDQGAAPAAGDGLRRALPGRPTDSARRQSEPAARGSAQQAFGAISQD